MKQKTGRKLLSFLLTLAMVVGLLPGMGLTVYAATYDGNPYASLVNTTTTVKFNDIDWYIIKDESTAVDVGTVTLFAKEMIGGSMFHSESNAYSTSTVKSYLDGLTTEGKAFAGVADAIETVKVKGSDSDNEVDAKLWLLSTEEANSLKAVIRLCSQEEYGYWWLRSPGIDDQHGVSVCGEDAYIDNMTHKSGTNGVRPALKLNLSKVTFDSNTFSLKSETTEYPLWVGGKRVTSANKNDVLGSADEGATVTYTPASGTTPAALTLNNANITMGYPDAPSTRESGIYYEGADALDIVLAEGSENSIKKSDGGFGYGIYSEDSNAGVTISGTGTLTVKGSDYGIKAGNNVTINGGNVSV